MPSGISLARRSLSSPGVKDIITGIGKKIVNADFLLRRNLRAIIINPDGCR